MRYEFNSFSPERVISGPGVVSELPKELERIGVTRALIVTGQTLATETDLVDRLVNSLGGRCVGTFSQSRQHVPQRSVEAALTEVRRLNVDGLVSFGGGSPIDTAKMIAYLRLGEGASIPEHIAIPTTLSAGEFTHAAGMTNEKTRVKSVYFAREIQPRVVLLDPEVTAATPSWLWAATGIRAMDHAIEAIWAIPPHPLVQTLAPMAAKNLHRHLQLSLDPEALEERLVCQHAAWMSIFGLLNLGLRLTHPIGHQLGARFDIPHGITSCVILPAGMRFLAPRTLEAQTTVAQALGVAGNSEEVSAGAAADAVENLIESLQVPNRLSATSARRAELPQLAEAIAEELREFDSPDVDIATPASLLQLLESVW